MYTCDHSPLDDGGGAGLARRRLNDMTLGKSDMCLITSALCMCLITSVVVGS
jgi:hypothetical protein